MSKSAWYWFGVADELARQQYENPQTKLSPVTIMVVALTATAGLQVIETVEQVAQRAIDRLGPASYYQKYWWLLYEETDPQPTKSMQEHRTHRTREWPPFTGLRVELGGDTA